MGSGQLGKEFSEILAGELPFERASRRLPVVLKIEEALGNGIEVGEVIGRQDLSLDDREVDLNLFSQLAWTGACTSVRRG